MDITAAKVVSSGGKFIKSTKDFEIELKQSLKWSKEQWKSSGESGSRFNRLCNSLHFWKKKLKPAVEKVSLVITLYNRENDVKICLLDIITEIEALDSNFVVQGFAEFRNPRYIGLYFASEEIKNKVKDKFRLLHNNFVVYLSWALEEENSSTYLKVHWLTMTIDIALIKKALDKYVSCIEVERKQFKFLSGREMPSGKFSFKVSIKKDIKLEEIPHVMNIAGLEALITVSGRKALCLNCETLGHISKNCKFRYCGICHDLKLPGHECISNEAYTYAGKLKTGRDDQSNVQLDDWEAGIIIDNKQNKDKDLLLVTDKIVEIQKKIKSSESQLVAHSQRSRKGEWPSNEPDESQSDVEEDNSSLTSGSLEENMDLENESFETEEGAEAQRVLVAKSSSTELKEINKGGKIKKKKFRRSNKKKIKDTEQSTSDQRTLVLDADQKIALEDKMITRSYGRVNLNNERRLREQKRFEKEIAKSPEKREFIFQD